MLFINEFRRLWTNPRFLFFLFVMCLAEIVVLCLQASSGITYKVESYRNFYEMIGEDSKSQDIQENPDISFYMNSVAKLNDDNGILATADLQRLLTEEINSVYSYREYISEISEQAQKMSSLFIFRHDDEFSQRNILKTYDRYNGLENLKPELGPSRGVELFSECFGTGILLILCMLFMVNELILCDRESGFLQLCFPTVRGRHAHGIAVIAVGLISCFIVTALLMTVCLVTCNELFGIGNIFRTVQSVRGLKSCPYRISLAEYFFISLVFRMFSSFLFFLLFNLFSVIFSSQVFVYSITILTTGIEMACYYLIDDNSYLVLLKRINPVSFADSGGYLNSFYCLNLRGNPIEYVLVVGILVPVLITVLIPVDVVMYTKQNSVTDRKSPANMKVSGRCRHRYLSVFIHEMYRLLVNGKVGLVLTAFAIIQFVTFEPMHEYFENEDAVYYKKYITMLLGEVTEEKKEYIEAEKIAVENAEFQLELLMHTNARSFSENYLQTVSEKLKWRNALIEVDDKKNELIATGGDFVHETGYRFLTGNLGHDKIIILDTIAAIMTVLCITGLFANDDCISFDRITSVCLKGGSRLMRKKLLLGACILSVVWSLNYLPYIYNVLHTYGFAGATSPAVSLTHLKDSLVAQTGISVRGYLILFYFVRYMIMVLEMCLITRVSRRVRSYGRTMIIGICVFGGPIVIAFVMKV